MPQAVFSAASGMPRPRRDSSEDRPYAKARALATRGPLAFLLPSAEEVLVGLLEIRRMQVVDEEVRRGPLHPGLLRFVDLLEERVLVRLHHLGPGLQLRLQHRLRRADDLHAAF